MMRMFRTNAGFSMPEMMTVLVIMGIVLAAATPNVTRYMRHDQVRGAADTFKARCMVAQQMAMSTRMRHRVVYDPDASAYHIEQFSGGNWVAASNDTTHLDTGITMTGGTTLDPTHHVVTFQPLGTVDINDVPALVSFANTHSDSSVVSIVRTGRMIVRHQ